MNTPHLKEGKSRTILLILVLSVFGVGWGVASTSSTTPEPEPTVRVLKASGLTLTLQEHLTRPRRAIGRVETRRRSSLGFEQPGRITTVHVEEGQVVQEGEVLALLDTERLEAQARQADAAFAEGSAILELRTREFDRQQELRRQDVVSAQRYDEAEQQLAQATAAVERIRAERDRIAVELKKSKLRAPYSGRIAMRFRDEGDVVSAGTPLFEMIEEPAWEIRAGLSAQQAASLRVGQVIPVKRSGGVDLLQADVLRILPSLQDQTRTVDVILTPNDVGLPFREGELVELIMEQRLEQAAFAIPQTSLQEGIRGTWVVYRAMPLYEAGDEPSGDLATHRIEARPVQLVGIGTDEVYVEGLIEEGDVILVEGLQKFTPGQSIRLNIAGEDA